MSDRVVIHLDSEGVADVPLNRAAKMNRAGYSDVR
jgi:hypothetical protein